MRSLYLRIYLTVVAALALFAVVSGWVVQRHFESQREEQRVMMMGAARERAEAWGDLLQRAMPPADAPAAEQVAALREWSQRLQPGRGGGVRCVLPCPFVADAGRVRGIGGRRCAG